jgi:hypothetical protein
MRDVERRVVQSFSKTYIAQSAELDLAAGYTLTLRIRPHSGRSAPRRWIARPREAALAIAANLRTRAPRRNPPTTSGPKG